MEALVWMRVPGDIVFSIGVVFLVLFALRLLRRDRGTQPLINPVTSTKNA